MGIDFVPCNTYIFRTFLSECRSDLMSLNSSSREKASSVLSAKILEKLNFLYCRLIWLCMRSKL